MSWSTESFAGPHGDDWRLRPVGATPSPIMITRTFRQNVPSNIRVYELARELGLTNKETLDLAEGLGDRGQESLVEHRRRTSGSRSPQGRP